MDIARGLGGKRNITSVDCCATRLRCSVETPALVDEKLLKPPEQWVSLKRVRNPGDLRFNVTVIKSNLEQYLADAPDEA